MRMIDFAQPQRRAEYLDKTNTNSLKGIFALFVVLHHIRNYITILNDTKIGMMLTALGYLSVAIFFFVSGYGLAYSYQKKGEKYLVTFPKNRILDFLVKYIIVFLFYGLTKFLSTGHIAVNVVIPNGWYLKAIFLTYLIFFFVMKCLPNKKAEHRYILIFLIYMVLCSIVTKETIWTESYFALLLGMLWCIKKKEIDFFLNNSVHYFVALVLSFVFFSITLLFGNLNIFAEPFKLIVKMVSALFFVIFVVLTIMKVKIRYKLTNFFGEISFEIYVFHGFILNLVFHHMQFIENVWAKALLVYILTIALSYIMHQLFKFVSNKIKVVE